MANRVRPEETEIRHIDEGLGKVHSVVEDPIEAQLGSRTVFHVESANRNLFSRQKDQVADCLNDSCNYKLNLVTVSWF